MKKCFAISVIMMLALSGCYKPSDSLKQKYNAVSVSVPPRGAQPEKGFRFKVERTQVVDDNVAYNSARGIYIITDTQTGKQYFGVSGIGITELGSHLSGKATITDER